MTFILGAILGGLVVFVAMCCVFVGKDKEIPTAEDVEEKYNVIISRLEEEIAVLKANLE